MLIVWECFLLSINHLEITGAGGPHVVLMESSGASFWGREQGPGLLHGCVATFRSSLHVSNGPHTRRLPFLTPWQEIPYKPPGSWEFNLRWKWNSLQTFTDTSWCFLRNGHKLQEIESQLWLYLEIWGRWGTTPEQGLLPVSFSDNSQLSCLPASDLCVVHSCPILQRADASFHNRLRPSQAAPQS